MPLTSKGREIKGAMEEEYGAKKGEHVFYASKNKGTISGVDESGMSQLEQESNDLPASVGAYDEALYKPVTSMTLADINRMGNELWSTPGGNVGSEVGSASSLPESASHPVPVYPAGDEVSPTQSDPPDRRSDNLLGKAHGGIDESAEEKEKEKEHKK